MYESEFEERLYNERRETLKAIAELGQKTGLSYAAATYPNSYDVKQTIPQLRLQYNGATGEQLEAERVEVSIAGRLMAKRLQGKAGFAVLQQGDVTIEMEHPEVADKLRLQIYVRKDDVGEDGFALYKLLDLGDHVGVKGYLMRTRTGELTVHVQTLTFLAKAMLALPDKYHGLEDTELRYRRRYVDLFMNTSHSPKPAPQGSVILSEVRSTESKDPAGPPAATSDNDLSATPTPATEPEGPPNVREVFVKRTAVLRALRRFFDARGYLEVETPMMHSVVGGATARPFTTHHNALDIDLFLRIAPELYLKRLVVGGFDRVYEINRNFRNEGVDTSHNPEFTMLEFYQAYANYHDLMDLTEEVVKYVAMEVNGTLKTEFNGAQIDLGKWTKLSMREAIIKWWPEDAAPAPSAADFEDIATYGSAMFRASDAYGKQCGGVFSFENKPAWSRMSLFSQQVGHVNAALEEASAQGSNYHAFLNSVLGKMIATTFEALAEEHLIQPHVIYDFPLAVSPLSKIKPDEPDWVERFEFYIGGFEVGNAFSELNDPEDQRARFEAQLKERERGDEEAMAEVDEDYVRALGYGLPPTAGEGIGIDRLTMILTGAKSIRDVILFPLMRPVGGKGE